MPYATSTDLLDRFDARVVCDFASDTDAPVPIGNLPTNTKVLAALYDASARIDAACQYGSRYLRADLTTLVADPDRQRGALIRSVTLDLAMATLVGRRLAPGGEIASYVPGLKASLEWLERLHNGDAVLDIDTAIASTLPKNTAPATNNPYRPSYYNPMFGYWPHWYR